MVDAKIRPHTMELPLCPCRKRTKVNDLVKEIGICDAVSNAVDVDEDRPDGQIAGCDQCAPRSKRDEGFSSPHPLTPMLAATAVVGAVVRSMRECGTTVRCLCRSVKNPWR
jgi:hypothetical protein